MIVADEGSRPDAGEATPRPQRSGSGPRSWLAVALMIGGFGLMAWFIGHFSVSAIGAALRTVGVTGLLAISLFHLMVTVLMGLAWWSLLRLGRPQLFIWARLVRDAGSEVLPLSQIGGYILGTRVAVMQGVSGSVAAASMIVDGTLEFCSQIAFGGLALALLLSQQPGSTVALAISVWLVVAIAAAATFIAVQRRGPDVPHRGAGRFLRDRLGALFSTAASVQLEIRRIHQQNFRLVLSFLLHFLAWIVTGIEAWLALRLMGATIGPVAVLTIEGLLYSARSLAFAVPAAFGVQEGAYVLLGSTLGLTPDLALALSLLKRGRDLVLGCPALVSWQLFEARDQRNAGAARSLRANEQESSARREAGYPTI
jgi:putative membrane protein